LRTGAGKRREAAAAKHADRKPIAMKKHEAEQISERALTFLASRPQDLQRFLTASGLDGSELLGRADDKAILAAVLGFLAADETIAKAFSEEERLKPGALIAACAILDPHGSTAW
jgi:hypothetical protein